MNDADLMDQLASPLRAEADKMHAELAQIDLVRDELLARLERIDGALNRLITPTKLGRPKGSKNGSKAEYSVSEKAVDEVLQFIEAHADEYEDGIIAARLVKAINLNGNPVSTNTVRKAVIVLHERGVLRADHKTVGGGTAYKLVR